MMESRFGRECGVCISFSGQAFVLLSAPSSGRYAAGRSPRTKVGLALDGHLEQCYPQFEMHRNVVYVLTLITDLCYYVPNCRK
jgi:hypothetical protein